MKALLLCSLLLAPFSGAQVLDALSMFPPPERPAKAQEGWWRFSDELVAFELPPEAVIVKTAIPDPMPEVPKPGERNISSASIYNEPRENPFARIYNIQKSDGSNLGAVMVMDQPWFDEGLCMCGPIALQTFEAADGNLIQFSQTEDGVVKAVQAINGTHRAMLSEWTHSRINFDDYERIGASLRLITPSGRSREEWISVTRARRESARAGVGWLRMGMTFSEVTEIMGASLRTEGDERVYESRKIHHDGTGYVTRITLRFRDGNLLRSRDGWISMEDIIPPHQVPQDIENLIDDWDQRQRFREEHKRHPEHGQPFVPPPAEVTRILDAFHQEAPSATGTQWEDWCKLLVRLHGWGINDKEAVAIVTTKFPSLDLRQAEAIVVLDLYQVPGRHKMLLQRFERVLDPTSKGTPATADFISMSSALSAGKLLPADLIRKGLEHPDEDIRADAMLMVDELPGEEARDIFDRKLRDPSARVRGNAIFKAHRIYRKEDERWLKELEAIEKDPDCRNDFRQLFGRLE